MQVPFFLLVALTVAITVEFSMPNVNADDPEELLNGVLAARYQLTNFEASIVAEQMLGELNAMPRLTQFDVRVDEANDRFWCHIRPLVDVELPKDNPELARDRAKWLESYVLRRDHRWSYGVDGELLFSTRLRPNYRAGYAIHTLGFSLMPIDRLTSDAIDLHRGVFGLTDPRSTYRLLSVPDSGDERKMVIVECKEESGATRRFFVEPDKLRLHRVEIPYLIYSHKLNEGELGRVTIESSFHPDNETVIPDDVRIRETVNELETHLIELKVVKFDRNKGFDESDFAFTNMGLRINRFVRDLDTGQHLGYWNGRDWSSKEPISGGKVVTDAIHAQEKPMHMNNTLRIIYVTSVFLVAILTSIWIWRRFHLPK